jgi:peptide/nickel transport system substrate-binding protein
MSQADFMTAAAGTDPKMWRDGVGFFTPGSPMASNAGMDIITAPKPDIATLERHCATPATTAKKSS